MKKKNIFLILFLIGFIFLLSYNGNALWTTQNLINLTANISSPVDIMRYNDSTYNNLVSIVTTDGGNNWWSYTKGAWLNSPTFSADSKCNNGQNNYGMQCKNNNECLFTREGGNTSLEWRQPCSITGSLITNLSYNPEILVGNETDIFLNPSIYVNVLNQYNNIGTGTGTSTANFVKSINLTNTTNINMSITDVAFNGSDLIILAVVPVDQGRDNFIYHLNSSYNAIDCINLTQLNSSLSYELSASTSPSIESNHSAAMTSIELLGSFALYDPKYTSAIWDINGTINSTSCDNIGYIITSNTAPIILSNGTIPLTPLKNTLVNLWLRTNDTDTGIGYVNWTLTYPNQTIITNQNSTFFQKLSEAFEIIANFTFNIGNKAQDMGTYNYNFTIYENSTTPLSTIGFNSFNIWNNLSIIYSNQTIPTTPLKNSTIQLQINISDITGDTPQWCNFSWRLPNGSNAFLNENATAIKTVNGTDWIFNSSAFTLDNNARILGNHTWNVTCSDGINFSSTTFNQFGISNNVPTPYNLTLLPNVSSAKPTTLRCGVNPTDADLDLINVTFQWFENQTLIYTNDSNLSVSNGTYVPNPQNFTNTKSGFNYTCSARVYDGINYSVWYNSSTIEMINNPPTINYNITINDTQNISSPYFSLNTPLKLQFSVNDIDNDTLQIIYGAYDPDGTYIPGMWYYPQGGQTAATECIGSSKQPSQYLCNSTSFTPVKYGIYRFVANASDGITSDYKSWNITIVDNSTSLNQRIIVPQIYGLNTNITFEYNLTLGSGIYLTEVNFTLLNNNSNIIINNINLSNTSSTKYITNASSYKFNGTGTTWKYWINWTNNYGLRGSYSENITITDNVYYNPNPQQNITYSKIYDNAQDEQKNFTFEIYTDSPETFNFNISVKQPLDTKYFNFTINQSTIPVTGLNNITNTYTVQLQMNISGTPSNGVYKGNLSLDRINYDNKSYTIPITVYVNPPAGEMTLYSSGGVKCTDNPSACNSNAVVTSTTFSYSQTWKLNNTGAYNISACNLTITDSAGNDILASTFSGYSFSPSNGFELDNSTQQTITLSSNAAGGSKTGNIQMKCKVDSLGNVVKMSASPYISITYSPPETTTGGGGGKEIPKKFIGLPIGAKCSSHSECNSRICDLTNVNESLRGVCVSTLCGNGYVDVKMVDDKGLVIYPAETSETCQKDFAVGVGTILGENWIILGAMGVVLIGGFFLLIPSTPKPKGKFKVIKK